LLSPAERADLVVRYSETNAEIAREYMGRDDGVLFRDPLPDPGQPWDQYDGSSSQALSEIWNFIRKHDPETFNLLDWAIKSALERGDEHKVNAARTLHTALRHVA
jgi:hypothetical protein